MKSAVADRLLAVSPVTNIGLPEEGHERVVPLTVAQVRSLVNSVPDRCRAMVVVQAGLGLRVGELLALRRQDVDFEEGMVRVEWQLTQDGKRREDPKTPWSRRAIPLPKPVADALRRHMSTFEAAEDGSLLHHGNRQAMEAGLLRTPGLRQRRAEGEAP